MASLKMADVKRMHKLPTLITLLEWELGKTYENVHSAVY